MKNLFICILALISAGCDLTIETTDPVYYDDEAYVVMTTYDYCMYDPLPYDHPAEYCDAYPKADCCTWVIGEITHNCSDAWCFYWDTCTWERVDLECW